MSAHIENVFFFRSPAELDALKLPPALKEAWRRHWKGDLQGAKAIYETLAWPDLDPPTRHLACADKVLLGVKLGQDFSRPAELNGSPHAARFILAYAEFSWAFFRKPDRIWPALRALLWQSLFVRTSGATRLALYLIGHMMAVDGRWFGFLLAKSMHRSMCRHLGTKARVAPFTVNIVLATFAYTHIAAEKLSEDLSRVIYFAEKYLCRDPYYQSIFQVSALYGYAYIGDVARTEIYASQLLEHQNLARYRPVAKIMTLLPMALRGYAFQVADEFQRIVEEHNEATTERLVNSQFYRASAVVALCLGHRHDAIALSKKASEPLSDTRSFRMWKRFDARFRQIAAQKKAFNPFHDRLLLSPRRVDFPPSLSEFFVTLVQLLGNASNRGETWFEGALAEKLTQHLECDDVETVHEMEPALLRYPSIRIGQHYLVFKVKDRGRNGYIRDVLSILAPVLRTLVWIVEDQRRLRGYERDVALANFSSQIAHDIHSPLTALTVALSKDSPLSGNRLKIARTAASRIGEMVQQLQARNRAIATTANPIGGDGSYWIGGIIEAAVSEKILETGATPSVSIIFQDRARSFGFFTTIPPVDLMRVLSNLLNNAIQAAPNGAKVRISVTQSGETISLQVRDNGCGIPPNILPVLGKEKLTHGKSGGNGLGLFSARQLLEEHQGRLNIESLPGEGACVTLLIPKAPPPGWFLPALELKPRSLVVILDDQSEAHDAWRQKLEDVTRNGAGIRLVHLYGAAELEKWLREKENHLDPLFLVDFDLRELDTDGIALVQQLGILNKSILVTGRDSDALASRCAELGLRMINKATLDLTPVNILRKH